MATQTHLPGAPASTAAIARSITRGASKQTFYTIRWLVDRGLIDDAYRAYAYFRWVDDTIDVASKDRRGEDCRRAEAGVGGRGVGPAHPPGGGFSRNSAHG